MPRPTASVGRARAAAPALAVVAVAFCAVNSDAQTNAAPVITAPGSQTYEQGETITPFGIAVSDADGDTVTVTVNGLPSGLSYANGQVQGTVSSSAAAQAYGVTIRADDGVNAAVEATFTITITATEETTAGDPPNAAPVITAPGSKTYEQGETIAAFAITVSDADGDPVSVTVNGLPSGLSYANGQVQGTVSSSAAAQAYGVTIGADDGVNAAVEATFTITITATEETPAGDPPNAAPVTTAPGSKTYEQGETITPFGITVSDADGDTVTVTVNGLPAGLSYANGQVQGTVSSSAAAQAYGVTIGADDGVNAAVEATFTITITATEETTAGDPPNAAPVITAPGSKTYEQGETITPFGITVSDADGVTVTVTVNGLPSGLSYANGEVQGTVSSSAAAQAYTVTIGADDGVNAAVESTFTITVTEAAAARSASNAPPVITSPGNKTYERGETIDAFGITVSDADGDRVTVTVTGLPSGLSYSNGQVAGTVADGASAGDHTVTILADDGGDEGAAETFTITVRARRATKKTSTSFSDHWGMKSDSLVPGNAFHVEEGDTLVVTFTWKGQGSQRAAWSTHGGLSGGPTYDVATSGTDYEAVIPARSVVASKKGDSVTIRHRIWEDGLVERNEVFQLGFRFEVGGVAIAAAFPVTILNDDRATITVSDATRSEGGDLEFTATLNTFLKGGIKVTPTFTDVTAVAGTDYTPNTTPITFAGRANEKKTFTVSTTQDVVAEQDETFRAGLDVDWTSTNFQSQNSYTGNGDVIAIAAATGTIEDDDARVTVADASASEGGSLTFTVTLDKAVAGGLTVTPSFTDGTATKGTDYTENTAALSFAGTAGETKTFTVATATDAVEESDETFTVGLAVSGTQETVAATDTATGTIYDTNRAAVVTIDDANGSEGGAMTFNVTLDRMVADGLTVTPSFTNGTATKGSDYTENTTALSFTGTRGETRTIRVALPDDSESEGDETFTVGLTVSGTTATVTATDTGTGTIFDDEPSSNPKMPYVTIADSSAAEGDTLTFTVTLGYNSDPKVPDGTSVVPGGLTVTPSFTDGTATKGTDYTATAAAPNFAGTMGETKTFTVSTTEDADIEPDETFTIGLGVSGTLTNVKATDTATGTITNDDGAQSSVTIADASAAEGDSITFTVTLSNAVPGGLTVTPSFTDVTATKGTDYTENTAGLTFTGTAGEMQTFTVSTTEDADPELAETFTVGLSVSGTSSTVTDTDTATGTITNDDGALPAVTVADASAAEGDSMTFTVTLDKAVSGGLTVTPSFTDSTATEGTDYTENTTALTFAGTAGETQTFTVATTEDSEAEVDEEFYLDLTVSGTQKAVKATDWALGTINDDDSSRLTVADASASEGNSMTFTVTLDKAVSGGLTVTPSFTDDTATEGADYTENTAGLTFGGTTGETKTFTVATTEDTEHENDETFTVGLTVSGTQKTVWAEDTATGTIRDDDAAALTIADASAAEGDSITFTVTLDKAVAGGLTVTPSFTDGTATKGTDYTENTAALVFTGTTGETRTFTVTTTEDTVAEPDEIFTVGLAVSGNQATVRATDTATGTITDNDSPALTIADAFVTEGGQIQFTMTLDKAVPGGLTVTASFTDVSATKGVDYTENTSPIVFEGKAGEQQTLSVDTTHDEYSEVNETFTVSLSVSGTSATVRATDTATGRIDDDDIPAKMTIADASATEGDSITFTLTLDRAVEAGFTVTPSFTDGTATEGTDYAENKTSITFAGAAGETHSFTVATTEDTVAEADETFTVSLDIPALGTELRATGKIDDDDAAAFTIDDAAAAEGDSLTFTVRLVEAVSGGVKVTPSFLEGTAKKGIDYTENTSALDFDGRKGEAQTFIVETIEDTDQEDDESFTVGLDVSGTSATVTATDTATGTIEDDDGTEHRDDDDNDDNDDDDDDDDNDDDGDDNDNDDDGDDNDGDDGNNNNGDDNDGNNNNDDGNNNNGGDDDSNGGNDNNGGTRARVTVADAVAVEGNALTFTVTLDRAVPGGLTVTPGLADETARSGKDYRAVTRTLRFAGRAGEVQTFSVPTVEDAVEEADETLVVSLSASATSATVTATDTARGRIVDDDLTPVVLQAEPARISETAGPTTVTVTAALKRGAKLSHAAVVNVTVGAATDAAAFGVDYTATPASFTVTIPAGSAEGTSTFTLDPENDTLMEPDEVLTVAGASGSRQVTGTAVTLEDDDTSSASLIVRLEPDSVSESAGPTQMTVIAEVVGATPTMPLPVSMRVGDREDTARLTVDYEPVDGFTVTIPAGETQHRATFVLTPIEDELLEGNETLTVTGQEWRLGAASDEGLIRDADLAEVRSEGTGRTLFLLARAIGSESLAAIEERFSGAGLGRRARLGAVPSLGPGALGGSGGPFTGTGMPGAGLGRPGVAVTSTAGPFGGPAGPSAAFGPGAMGMGPGMPSEQQPFEELAWLDGAGFTTPLAGIRTQADTPGATEPGDEAGWVVWGRAGTTRTAVQATPGAQARGDLFTVHLGIDTRVGSRLLVGVAASHSRGKLGYTLGSQADAVPATVDGDLTSAQPYLQWTPRAGLEVWGFGGAGRGELQVVDTFGTVETGLGMRMGAGGVRQAVTAGGGLAVKADVFHVAMASDANPDLPEARATATRARMLLEWESEWAPSPSARVRPRLEVGGRWDGGSDVDGFGSEVGGGIALAHVGLGLELSGSGRYLLAHQAEGFEEWGASLALRAGPGVTRRGAWVSVEPEWGAAASQMHAMWGQQPDPGLHSGASRAGAGGAEPGRLRLAAGYALPEAGTDLRVEATRENYNAQSGPSIGVRFAARIGW